MPKMFLKCDWCGNEYSSYQCGKYHHFCCIECRRKAGKLVASSFSADTRSNASKRITFYNKNVFNHGEYKKRQAEALRGTGEGYIKVNGRHLHRQVVEKVIGRKLLSNEIVHHIDGDKQNNSPDNLQIVSRSEHIKIHLRKGGGRLASFV